MVKKKGCFFHEINREWCKGCGICVHFCPSQVLVLDNEEKALAAHPEECIGCKMCELRCPDLAIVVGEQSGGQNEV